MRDWFLSLLTHYQFRRYLRLVLGVTLTLLALYLGLRTITLEDILAALSNTNYLVAFYALLSVAVNTLAKTIRWKVLIGFRGRAVTIGKALGALLVGQMLNTLSFVRVGDISRVYIIGGMGVGRVYTASTLVVEKFLDTLAFTLLFLLLLLLIQLPEWIAASGYTFLILSLILTVVILIAAFHSEWILRIIERVLIRFPRKVQNYAIPRLQAALDGLYVFQNLRDVSLLAFWSAIIWGTAVLTNHLALIAMEIHLPLTASIILLLGLQAGISLPSTPGRIGIFEYICVLVLALFGVSQATAFGYGILLHIIVLFPTTLAGVVIFGFMGVSKENLRIPIEPDPTLEDR